MNPLEDQQYLYESFALSPDYDVKIHKNGIVLVFTSLLNGWQRLKFDPHINEQLSQLSGKRKHGAITQLADMVFAEVVVEDKLLKIPSPLRAKLIEVNWGLEEKVETGKLLCIYHPKWDQVQQFKNVLAKRSLGEDLTDDDKKFMAEFVLRV